MAGLGIHGGLSSSAFSRGNTSSSSSLANNSIVGAQNNKFKDFTLANGPEDSISAVRFSTVENYLAVASWDSKVRIYDVKNVDGAVASGMNTPEVGRPLAGFEMGGPVFSVDWSRDGTMVVGAGADKTARILPLNANGAQAQQVAVHDAPIKSVRFVQPSPMQGPLIATASWDKTVKYWDMRTPQAVGSIVCQDKIYSMDAKDDLLVVGTAERFIDFVRLSDPFRYFRVATPALQFQTKVVTCFNGADGAAIGTVGGRIALESIHEKAPESFTFRCHRSKDENSPNITNIYSVNDVSFHPVHGTVSTAGSDGSFHFWDRIAKNRLKGYDDHTDGAAISATAFNADGRLFAYAISYDWSKGFAFNTPQYPTKVKIHQVTDDDCKPKTKSSNNRR